MTEKELDAAMKFGLSVMVFFMALAWMRVTDGDSGIGWGILGLALIWK